MARRYARDSRGRFSSSGATSRGKRLGGKGGAPAARTSGSSAPKGTIARGSVNRSIASLRGQASGTTVSARTAAPGARKAPAKMGKATVGREAKAAFKSAKTTAMTLARRADLTGKTPAGFNAAANKLRRMVATRKTTSSPKRATGGRKRKG